MFWSTCVHFCHQLRPIPATFTLTRTMLRTSSLIHLINNCSLWNANPIELSLCLKCSVAWSILKSGPAPSSCEASQFPHCAVYSVHYACAHCVVSQALTLPANICPCIRPHLSPHPLRDPSFHLTWSHCLPCTVIAWNHSFSFILWLSTLPVLPFDCKFHRGNNWHLPLTRQVPGNICWMTGWASEYKLLKLEKHVPPQG